MTYEEAYRTWLVSPLAAVVEALAEGRHPPLEWVMRHNLQGHDPLHVAWQVRNQDPSVRLCLMRLIAQPQSGELVWLARLIKAIDIDLTSKTTGQADDAIRIVFAEDLPTLPELLERYLAQSEPEF